MAIITPIGSSKPIQVAFGGTGAVTLTGVLTGNGTSAITAATVTQHGVLLGGASNAVSSLGVAATGSTLMGATGADPAFTGSPSFSGSVTAGTTITATSGAITATSGNVVITSGNLAITAATTSSVGQITQAGSRIFHTFGTNNTVIGKNSMNFTTTGSNNVFVGDAIAGSLGAAANGNVGVGSEMFNNLTTGNSNVGIGFNSLYSITTGVNNTAIGYASFNNTGTSSSYNVGLGANAGSSATGTSSSNIYINNAGAAESNTLRIGASTGTGNAQLNASFIHGVFGITTGVSGIPVLVDNAGQFGTVASSIRYKENVQDLSETRVLELHPVRFNYKQDGRIATGLIAEEVEQIMPQLVAYNAEGQPQSVMYHDLPVLLLAEIQKLRKELDELKRSM